MLDAISIFSCDEYPVSDIPPPPPPKKWERKGVESGSDGLCPTDVPMVGGTVGGGIAKQAIGFCDFIVQGIVGIYFVS